MGDYFLSIWKRGFLEINAEILQSLKSGSLQKTQISSLCNLDSRAVKKYLSLMKSLKLVEPANHNSLSFSLTEKGLKYINQYEALVGIIEGDMKKSEIEGFTKLMRINPKINNL